MQIVGNATEPLPAATTGCSDHGLVGWYSWAATTTSTLRTPDALADLLMTDLILHPVRSTLPAT